MNSLLHEGLIATKNVSSAAIIKRKECTIKAKSGQFQPELTEIQKIDSIFEKPSEIRAQGGILRFMDVDYKLIRADKFSIYGKGEKCGLVVCKTNNFYLIALYDSSMYASVAVESTEKLGNFNLRKAEYLRRKEKS
jgi:profilin